MTGLSEVERLAVVVAVKAGEAVEAVEAVEVKCLDLEIAVLVIPAVQQETLDSLVSNAWGLRI